MIMNEKLKARETLWVIGTKSKQTKKNRLNMVMINPRAPVEKRCYQTSNIPNVALGLGIKGIYRDKQNSLLRLTFLLFTHLFFPPWFKC